MTGIEFLKKATIADSLGKFKLADRYFNRAVRLAGIEKFTAEAIAALEKAGIEAGERTLIEAGTKSLQKALEEQALKAFEEALGGKLDKLREMLKLSGKTDVEIAAKMREYGPLVGEARREAMVDLAKEIQAKNESLFKLESGPGPGPGPKLGDPPIEIPPGLKDPKALLAYGGQALSFVKKLGPLWAGLANNPNKFIKFAAWFATIGGTWQITGTVIEFFVKGVKITPTDLWNMLTKAKPDLTTGEEPAGSGGGSGEAGSGEAGSGEGGAAGAPGSTTAPDYNYKTKEEMYERRMKAKLPGGKFQQTLQSDAAQNFVDENKTKYNTQREFYNAALQAGDKNFANSVIALVKKDLDLIVDTNDPRKF